MICTVSSETVSTMSFDTDGTVAVSLTCGNERLQVWLCLDFFSDTAKLWDLEFVQFLRTDPSDHLICGELDSLFVVNRTDVAFNDDHSFCSGTLPVGRHSDIWYYVDTLILDYPHAKFVSSSPDATELETSIVSDRSWYRTHALVPDLTDTGSMAPMDFCSVSGTRTVKIFPASTTKLDGDVWSCAVIEEAVTIQSPTEFPGDTNLITRDEWDDAGKITTALTTDLGTGLLRSCKVVLRGFSFFAVKCETKEKFEHALYGAAVLAIFCATFALYPVVVPDWKVSLAGLGVSLFLLVMEGFRICDGVPYSFPAVISIMAFGTIAVFWGTAWERVAALSYICGLALHSCFSSLPLYCGSSLALLTEIVRLTAAILAISHANLRDSTKNRKWRMFKVYMRLSVMVLLATLSAVFFYGCEDALGGKNSKTRRVFMSITFAFGAMIVGSMLASASEWIRNNPELTKRLYSSGQDKQRQEDLNAALATRGAVSHR